MQIDRVLFPIESLGPGNRLVIWTVGCSKHCDNCSNRELWAQDPDKDVDPAELAQAVLQAVQGQKVDGITLTGGDPFEQLDQLTELLQHLSPLCDDILVYTGYTMEELQTLYSPSALQAATEHIGVIIDGRYIDDLNDDSCVLRGSSNQRILFLKDALRQRYLPYLQEGRKIQNVFYKNKVISVGIHSKEK